MKILNKKSQIHGRKMFYYIIFGFVAIVVFFFIIWLTSSEKSEISIIPPGLENYLLTQRFLNSALCFAFQDEDTDRIYPWLIDLNKFNQDTLNKCYGAEETNVKAYKLTLTYGENKVTLNTKNWEGFLKSGETKDIFVIYEGGIQREELFIEMQDVK